MNEPFNRLMKARRVAGYRSARSAAAVLGVKPATYAAHENGTRSFSVDDAIRYAQLYNVSPGWILTGEHFAEGSYAKVSDSSLTEPHIVQNPSEEMTHSAIYSFGKQALELLGRIEPTVEPDPTGDSTTIGEVVIQLLLDEDFEPEAEQWEIVAQWQFPLSYYTDVLKVDPVDVAVLSVVHDNMSPTFEIGDRLIIDFKQKVIGVDGVYIFISDDGKMHIQRLTRGEKQVFISNDNPAKDTKHPESTVDENALEIVGRICGVIATR